MLKLSRRGLLKSICGSVAAMNLSPRSLLASNHKMLTHRIPSSGEPLAIVGMGTFRTFDAGNDKALHTQLTKVLQTFFDYGGELIDTSPHYDTSEETTGNLLKNINNKNDLFTATKIRTDEGRQAGINQMHGSMARLDVPVIDLLQIHNLVDWETHIKTLRVAKQSGKIRYLGITTSQGRDHQEFVDVMRKEDLDFVQFSYNIIHRHAEKEIFPIAADKGIATLINMPFQRGELFKRTASQPLPDWASEIDCSSWAQIFLKYAVSHPAATCVIPATSSIKHMQDNMKAGYGRLPDAELRKRMEKDFESLI